MGTIKTMKDAVWDALSRVQDPEIRRPVTELGMIEDITVTGDIVKVSLLLTIVGCPQATTIEHDIHEAAMSVPGVRETHVRVSVMSPEQRQDFIQRVKGDKKHRQQQFGPNSLTRVIAVTSGKGGVGKSSITAHLALSFAHQGLNVGIIDADIFGFSIPGLIGLVTDGVAQAPTNIDGMIVPPVAHGVKVISIGMFLGGEDTRDTAVSWRGPMLHRTLEQFLTDVWFGDLDILLVDLPPGTGDIALSLGQLLPQAEVLVVTTPQIAAADVAVRSGILALKSGQRILGVVENMAGLVGPDGTVTDVFGSGGGEAVAERLSQHIHDAPQESATLPVTVLGKVPLSIGFREACDEGVPGPREDATVQAIEALSHRILSHSRGLAGRPLPINPR